METHKSSADRGRHRFSISTKLMKDYGIEAPVSGATQLVTARGGKAGPALFSIGTDQRIHHFSRDGKGRWKRLRLPWKATSMAVVPQRDGTDKVFFAQFDGGSPDSGKIDFGVSRKSRSKKPTDQSAAKAKTATVYELENAGREPQRRLLGRFTTTDPKVYGLRELSGVQCRDGSNILVTALAARPGSGTSNWMVLFGHGSSTGALSLGDGKGVVARKVRIANGDPGSTRWPHMTFVLLDDCGLRVEWGSRSGALLQSERLPIPELPDVVEFEVVRDHRGFHRIFALDRDRQLHVLCQIGGGGARPPHWTSSWLRLDVTRPDGSRPALRQLRALRRSDGDLVLFALDDDDLLWSIHESADAHEGWGDLVPIGQDRGPRPVVRAAHLSMASTEEGHVELFAVSRQNELLRLSQGAREGKWHVERIGWDTSGAEKIELNVYRTGLTILDEEKSAVSGVPVRVTANETTPSVVNGLSYALGPGEPVLAETNAFGKICVTFELNEQKSVPSLSFEAGFLGRGQLEVCPEHKAHLYVRKGYERTLPEDSTDPRSGLFLIPEDTVIEQA